MSIDPERARAIFVEAVGRGPPQRADLLAARCGGDNDLRRHVENLLRANDEGGSFLDRPAAAAGPTDTYRPAGRDGAPGAGTVVGPYKLVEPIGEGAMGAVWLAQQTHPVRRLVALKVIKAGMDTRQVVARFEAERQALALMDHPHIAKVLDAGATPAGRPFFVMELVKGVPITKYCDEHRLTPRRRLELFVPVCHAIQHAHQKGVIHRDIKPSNVLVALYDDRPVPKVIDFGVAKATGQQLTEQTLHTGFGAVVGTVEYMSPEQATFNQLDIDTRSDIYSLGVLLYELLTGSPPFSKKDLERAGMLEMLRVIREQEPSKPSTKLSTAEGLPTLAANRGTEPARLTRLVRGELDWIVMKALEKDRARRYESANGFAADVQRYLTDEPVAAGPPSAGYRLRKFVRRNRGRVAAGTVVLVALVGGLIGTAFGVIEAGNQRVAYSLRRQAERARGEAEAARDGEQAARAEVFREKEKLAAFEYGKTTQVVHQEWRDNNVLTALRFLEGTRKDLRGWEWHYLHRLCHGDLLTLKGPSVSSAVFSPDGARVATAGADGTARLWDATTGTQLVALQHAGAVSSVAFSPDGRRVATGSSDRTARVWDATTGAEVAAFRGHAGHVSSVAFSPDGARVATGSHDRTARVWDAETGAELAALRGHTNPVSSVAFSPDGARIVTASLDTTVRVWDAKTGASLLTIKGHANSVTSAAFSPDGGRVVTASRDTTARIWDPKTGAQLNILLGHTTEVYSAAFSPDGSRIVTASLDTTARVWSARTGNPVLALRHTGPVLTVAFSPDGARVVTAGGDGTARVWDAKTGAEVLDPERRRPDPIVAAAFRPNGRQVVLGSQAKAAKVWDAETGIETLALAGHTDLLSSMVFSPDGARVATGSMDGTARVWDARTGAQVAALTGHSDQVSSVAFSPDGARVATGSMDGTARVWDATTAAELVTLRHTGPVRRVAFSPDGARVATGSLDGAARVWDATTGVELLALTGHTDRISSVAFSPVGARVVTASRDMTARVWDAGTGAEVFVLRHTQWVQSAAFSPDGARVLTAGWESTARVWDAKTGAELLALKGHTSPLLTAAFSPDGARILTAGINGRVRVWDCRPVNREFLPRDITPGQVRP